MEFHFTNDAPLYLQLAAFLETQIIAGHLEPGQKLPSVRELALMSKTNPNTVAKALTQLEQKGLIETRRTSGKFVKPLQDVLFQTRIQKAKELGQKFLEDMAVLGFSHQESLEMLRKLEKEDRDASSN